MKANQIRRPVLRYFGGKFQIATWVISFFPDHTVYVEPFSGAASILIKKPRSKTEIINDIDQEVFNLFSVLRTNGAELVRQIKNTPFSRTEYDAAHFVVTDPLERARRMIVRHMMGYGSNSTCDKKKGFIGQPRNAGKNSAAVDFVRYPDCLEAIVERLKGVVVENRDYKRVMESYDSPVTLHYLDPPYVNESRSSRHKYSFEMDEAGHVEMIEHAKKMKGALIISGYQNAIYERHLSEWGMQSRPHYAQGGVKKTECIWISPNGIKQGVLF